MVLILMAFKGTLKPYQPEAVDKMVDRKKMLVAYEMGLGKTCMTIAAIEELPIDKPILIIALSSLKYQWGKEISKFSDSTYAVIDGNKAKRENEYISKSLNCKYVITNYESIVNDWDVVSTIDWGAIVCDEATAIKGFRSKRSKKVKDLARQVPIRFALTGTPIENGRPEELYSIMQFVDPNVLGRFDLFDQTFIVRNHFGGVQRYRNLPLFHEKMKQASVRKTQNDPDVAPYLPETMHLEPMWIDLGKSKPLYQHIATDLKQLLSEAQELFGNSFSLEAHYGQGYQVGSPADQMRGQIMSRITAMRMLCDHPQLLVDSADKFEKQEGEGSEYAFHLKEQGLLKTFNSNKLEAVAQYVEEHLEVDENAKVVIFTTYLGMLPLLENSLAKKKIKSTLYSGLMNAKEKEDSKTLFQTSKDIKVLISTDAGGYGVDLPQANLLVNYDLPWSAGTAVQRNSRIRRASSTWKSVIIQDFLAANSIEERQHQMLQQKNAVADAVIDGQGINTKGGVDLTVGSLLSFLQGGK
jgi:SNF2 family DNA or RNA helicase